MRGVLYASVCLSLTLVMFAGIPTDSESPVPSVAAGGSFIQPGDYSAAGNAGCTLNFVFDGVGDLAGKVYMGTAAHCVSHVGQAVRTDGHGVFGHVAFIDSACCTKRDYAFIEVLPEFEELVNPSVRGHQYHPRGFATAEETAPGDITYFSGWGMGFGWTQVTREGRAGVLVYGGHEFYQLYGPIIWGDSGGPVTLQSGQALGIVSRLNFVGGFEQGPTVEGMLNGAAAKGFTVELRSVSF